MWHTKANSEASIFHRGLMSFGEDKNKTKTKPLLTDLEVFAHLVPDLWESIFTRISHVLLDHAQSHMSFLCFGHSLP